MNMNFLFPTLHDSFHQISKLRDSTSWMNAWWHFTFPSYFNTGNKGTGITIGAEGVVDSVLRFIILPNKIYLPLPSSPLLSTAHYGMKLELELKLLSVWKHLSVKTRIV